VRYDDGDNYYILLCIQRANHRKGKQLMKVQVNSSNKTSSGNNWQETLLPCEMEASRLLLLGFLKLPESEKCWYQRSKKSTTCTAGSCVLLTRPRISQNHLRDYRHSVCVYMVLQYQHRPLSNHHAHVAFYILLCTDQSSTDIGHSALNMDQLVDQERWGAMGDSLTIVSKSSFTTMMLLLQ